MARENGDSRLRILVGGGLMNIGLFEQLVENELKELIPQIDTRGADKRMFELAIQDYRWYLMIKWKINSMLDFRTKFLEVLASVEAAEGIRIFTRMFFKTWYKKWKQRVKIIVRDQEWACDKQQVSKMIMKGASMINSSKLNAYKEPIIATLVKYGEVACMDLFAEQLIKRQLADKGAPDTLPEEINFISLMTRMAREISGTKGPVVFIKIDKNYFRKST